MPLNTAIQLGVISIRVVFFNLYPSLSGSNIEGLLGSLVMVYEILKVSSLHSGASAHFHRRGDENQGGMSKYRASAADGGTAYLEKDFKEESRKIYAQAHSLVEKKYMSSHGAPRPLWTLSPSVLPQVTVTAIGPAIVISSVITPSRGASLANAR